jgi:hypothetical protein
MAQLTQLPDVVDLSFVSGDTFRIRVRVIDPGTQQPLTTLTSANIEAWIAHEGAGGGNVADFAKTDDPATSSVILTLSPKETEFIFSARLPITAETFKGRWDLEVTFPPVAPAIVGDVRTVAKGSVTVFDDITNSGTAPPPPM